MLRQKVLPAILLILPAAGALTAQTTIVEATTEPCRTRPGSVAPAGGHWYYRINRGDNHRCWYISSQRVGVRWARRGVSLGRSNFVGHRTNLSKQLAPQESEIDERMTSAQMKPTEATLTLEQATLAAFTSRWPDLPELEAVDVRKVATTSYTEDPVMHADQIPLVFVADGKRAGQQQGPAVFEPVILGGALMTVLLITGGVFRLTRRHVRTYSADQRYASADQPDWRAGVLAGFAEPSGNGSAPETRYHRPDRPILTVTDPGEDLETSLRDLTRDLQRAVARHVSRRSFSARTCTTVVSRATQPTIGAASAKRLA